MTHVAKYTATILHRLNTASTRMLQVSYNFLYDWTEPLSSNPPPQCQYRFIYNHNKCFTISRAAILIFGLSISCNATIQNACLSSASIAPSRVPPIAWIIRSTSSHSNACCSRFFTLFTRLPEIVASCQEHADVIAW